MGLGLLLLLGSLVKINNWCDYYSSGVLIVCCCCLGGREGVRIEASKTFHGLPLNCAGVSYKSKEQGLNLSGS